MLVNKLLPILAIGGAAVYFITASPSQTKSKSSTSTENNGNVKGSIDFGSINPDFGKDNTIKGPGGIAGGDCLKIKDYDGSYGRYIKGPGGSCIDLWPVWMNERFADEIDQELEDRGLNAFETFCVGIEKVQGGYETSDNAKNVIVSALSRTHAPSQIIWGSTDINMK